MGSLPDSKYIIQTDGYYFVESHDVDPSKGYITVSAKGVINGLSNQPNDGADFGPDTYDPNYTGSGIPYTQTSGIQEALNYSEVIKYSGSIILLSAGNFAIGSTIQLNNPGQVTIIGNGYNTTNLYPTTTGITIFKGPCSKTTFKDFMIISGEYNSNTAAWGIDLSQTEGVPNNAIIHVQFNGTFTSGWFNLDGNENSFVDLVNVENQGSVTTGFSWKIPNGAGYISRSYLAIGGTSISGTVEFQQLNITDSVIGVLQLTGNANDLRLKGVYTADSRQAIIDLNGNNLDTLDFEGYISLGNSNYLIDNSQHATTGSTIILCKISGFQNTDGSSVNWIQANTYVNKYMIDRLYVYANITGQPFTVNGNIPVLGGNVTTPSVPTSGTAQQNTNPYPVNVYLYGGTVTVIDYTPSGGSSTQVGTSGPATVRLNPGDSITLTYSAAPTWNWVAV